MAPQPWLYQYIEGANQRLFGKLLKSGTDVIDE